MSIYRMRIPASVCITIEADDEEKAIKACKQIVEDWQDGYELDFSIEAECDPHAALYLHEKLPADEIGVEDIDDSYDYDDEDDSESIFDEEPANAQT